MKTQFTVLTHMEKLAEEALICASHPIVEVGEKRFARLRILGCEVLYPISPTGDDAEEEDE